MATAAASAQQFKQASILDHLEELRWRLIYAVAAWMVGSGVAYAFRDRILAILQGPLQGFRGAGNQVDVVATSVTDPLVTVFYVAGFGGLILALPVIVYQIWAFVAPGLTDRERRWGGPFIVGLGFSFAIGCAFAYFVILPYAIPFLLGLLSGIRYFLSIGTYIQTMVTYMAIFGLLFELPITLFLLTKVGLVNARGLAAARRVAVMVIVAASAILTPTADPFNLALMAVPMWLLYELGIVLSRVAGRQ
ncbi:MAG TPA: twin-arginine translocase subunit TatC [Deinococcales bacterium]|nr:twin-arginine translocase subunit TatC [Deinococcales bacterium]